MRPALGSRIIVRVARNTLGTSHEFPAAGEKRACVCIPARVLVTCSCARAGLPFLSKNVGEALRPASFKQPSWPTCAEEPPLKNVVSPLGKTVSSIYGRSSRV
jgi:hypothetical protein